MITDVWELRFSGGLADGASVEVEIVAPPPLAFVYPCPDGCEATHRRLQAHLALDLSVVHPGTVVYRRKALERSRMLAVYELGDHDPSALESFEELRASATWLEHIS